MAFLSVLARQPDCDNNYRQCLAQAARYCAIQYLDGTLQVDNQGFLTAAISEHLQSVLNSGSPSEAENSDNRAENAATTASAQTEGPPEVAATENQTGQSDETESFTADTEQEDRDDTAAVTVTATGNRPRSDSPRAQPKPPSLTDNEILVATFATLAVVLVVIFVVKSDPTVRPRPAEAAKSALHWPNAVEAPIATSRQDSTVAQSPQPVGDTQRNWVSKADTIRATQALMERLQQQQTKPSPDARSAANIVQQRDRNLSEAVTVETTSPARPPRTDIILETEKRLERLNAKRLAAARQAAERLAAERLKAQQKRQEQNDPALALYRNGLRHFSLKENDEAIGEFERAAKLNPKDSRIHYFRGLALLRIDQHDEAIEAFKLAAENETKAGDSRDVSISLEHIQGPERQLLESYRP